MSFKIGGAQTFTRTYDNPLKNYYHPNHRYPDQEKEDLTTERYPRPTPFTVRMKSMETTTTVSTTTTTQTPFTWTTIKTTPFTVRPKKRRRFRPYLGNKSSGAQSYFHFSRPNPKIETTTEKENFFYIPPKMPFLEADKPFTVRPTRTPFTVKSVRSTTPFTVRPRVSIVPHNFVKPHKVVPSKPSRPAMFDPEIFKHHDVELKNPFANAPDFYKPNSDPELPSPPAPKRPPIYNHRIPPNPNTKRPPFFKGPPKSHTFKPTVPKPVATFGKATFDLDTNLPDRPMTSILRDLPNTSKDPSFPKPSNSKGTPYLKNQYGSNFIRLEVDSNKFGTNSSRPNVGIHHIPLMMKPHIFPKRKRKPGFRPPKLIKGPKLPLIKKNKGQPAPPKVKTPGSASTPLVHVRTKPAFIPPIRIPPHTSVKPVRKQQKRPKKMVMNFKEEEEKGLFPFSVVKDVMQHLPDMMQNMPLLMQKLMSPHAKLISGRSLDRKAS